MLTGLVVWTSTAKPSYVVETVAFPQEWGYAFADSMDRYGRHIVVAKRTATAPATNVFALSTKDGTTALAAEAGVGVMQIASVLDDGTVVGTAFRDAYGTSPAPFGPFAIGPSKTIRDSLSLIANKHYVELIGANDKGDVAANIYRDPPVNSFRDAIYGISAVVDGKKIDLENQRAFAMNGEGAIVCSDPDWADQVVTYDHGKLNRLFHDSNRGLQPEFRPTGISATGAVIGSDGNMQQTFVLFEDGAYMHIQGRTDQFMIASSINSSNEVVGTYSNGGGSGTRPRDPDGFLWSGHRLYALSSLVDLPKGSMIVGVQQIIDNGDILVTLALDHDWTKTVPAVLRRKHTSN
ncbi:MAG TPA: hypothetical protein VNI20_04745 [Fimbriimonadaceae bacterium]|nr:hypothetical protein [Fimbriimonadaceae bacterium]